MPPVDAISTANIPEKSFHRIESPAWIRLTSEKDTVLAAGVAVFGMTCAQDGDLDWDGQRRPHCPRRFDEWGRVTAVAEAMWPTLGDEGCFRAHPGGRVRCDSLPSCPIKISTGGSGAIITSYEYFDSIHVAFKDERILIELDGNVRPDQRGFHHSDIADGGEADRAETIIVLRGTGIRRISIRSEGRILDGDFAVQGSVVRSISPGSVWPCKATL